MATFSASSSAIANPYPTAGPGANPLFEEIVVRGPLLDTPFSLEEWPGAQPPAESHATNPFF